MTTTPLPIDAILPNLLQTARTAPCAVLHAPPGAGKTSRVPLALLDVIPPEAGRIVMLEPRRIAAASAARWMARTLGEEVGQTVGYSIRFETRVSPATRVEVVTEGILTRRIQNDPLLEGVGMVIFDEFHERSIQADLGLALCLEVQRQVRPDLKILVMSATLDVEPLARLMGDAPVLSSAGRSFPVEEVYLEERSSGRLPDRMVAAIQRALRETEGDLLAFLPGSGEIRTCASLLAGCGLGEKGVSVHQLYGDLPFDEQQRAIQPGRQRRVVLATSIAETSLTIEGVRTVIDSGLSRRLRFDPASGMNRLVTVRESASSAEQRKGRAGRLGPGTCYRLFSRHTLSAMTPHTPPEILDTDLSPLVLELAAWGVADPQGLAWLDPPPAAALAVGRRLLADVGALDAQGRITAPGRSMMRLPLHPRLSRLLLRAQELGCSRLGCDLAALVSERDIFRAAGVGRAPRVGLSDIGERLECLHAWRNGGSGGQWADTAALKAVERVSRQLAHLLPPAAKDRPVDTDEATARLLLAAYPDRVARSRGDGEGRYLLASGRGARLSPRSVTRKADYIVAVDVDGGGQGEGTIHLASEVGEELLHRECAGLIVRQNAITWSEREKRIVAAREECFGALRLSSAPYTPAREEACPVILEAVRASHLELLDMNDGVRRMQGRVALLRRALPEDGWPDLSDENLLETLEEWLGPHLAGVRTAQQLRALDLAPLVLGLLDYRRQRLLDELAPTHLEVPSGSRIRLDYGSGEWPVLAVKLQELFGLADTPAIARGRVGVLLHLLSPAGRPIQVTRDLKGFWNGAYHEVKKELKGRYPKHPWPDDPWSAQPTRRAKPRGS
ncbi:ATP-dependent helicase HrpB [Geobacter sp. FeAm09]|uniref:ATP-dependent helicase HrpB n=1 Tax=Geobacter sp. FeAm09 TaxID=2597769 RepID=UPI0011F0330F|nr:ATP-dependent helicase HrpB [Geobacter sp. FeAm09]QEM68183.1 ATP-dependent helicase HrpB [Geobacter sp. FeAm09]